MNVFSEDTHDETRFLDVVEEMSLHEWPDVNESRSMFRDVERMVGMPIGSIERGDL